jgi:transposase
MPWAERWVMDERLPFVARLLDGVAMTAVCREFGISLKTRYKIFERYKEHGLDALTELRCSGQRGPVRPPRHMLLHRRHRRPCRVDIPHYMIGK